MPLGVSYMGTKRALAAAVAEIVERGRAGPFLDVFAGMCAVGTAVSPSRSIWSNDAQLFASTVARAFFCSSELPPDVTASATVTHDSFARNEIELCRRFENELELEEKAIADGTVKAFVAAEEACLARYEDSNDEISRLRRHPTTFPHRLFSTIYAGTYLGLRQCIQVDSLHFSITELASQNKISEDARRWYLLALCKAVSRCSTSTGHFAQFLSIKAKTKKRYARQRSKSIVHEWMIALGELSPFRSRRWRSANRVFCGDALDLLFKVKDSAEKPSVIYADPPYTDDQYSRYYHLYETILLYDYPKTSSKARYREERSVSSFSVKREVASSIDLLISRSSEAGADLVLSYPTNGLLENSRTAIPDMLARHYRRVDAPMSFEHVHSTMGASKGEASSSVTEMVYRASNR
ncbi:DNA adenine methylase [Terrarubrum flagellatum]|uniref:DNA adenine methylase n=1 Tax=Terrirubrum flagellatum TaxID=2895980 RepID=UPI00314560C8